MEPRISIITLGVKDLRRSLQFYRDGLGLPTTMDGSKGIVFFQTRGTCLALYPYDELERDVFPARNFGGSAALDPGHTGKFKAKFPGITLAHNVRSKAEVDAVLSQAEKAGAKIEKPAADTEWGGYSGYFSDPDGYLWEIAWGAFDFRDDGSLAIP